MPDATVTTQAYNPDTDHNPVGESTGGENKIDSRSVEQPVTDRVDDPVHRDQMIKKADLGTGAKEDTLIAGKYTSQEEFDKAILSAYKKKHGDNLEEAYKKLSADLSQETTEEPATEETEAEESETEETVTDPVTPEVFDLDSFVQEYNADGRLSEDSYSKLKDAGFERGMVDTYMAGVQAQRDSLFSICGGKDNFFQMTEWAAEDGGLTDSEIDTFNSSLNSGDMGKMKQAVEYLKLKFNASGRQTAPSAKIESTHIDAPVGGYTTPDEHKLDVANPLYKKSAAFRAQVREKLRRSNF